jgi:hypothetical protein
MIKDTKCFIEKVAPARRGRGHVYAASATG